MTIYTRVAGERNLFTSTVLHESQGLRDLSDIMEFDHVIEVHADGSVSDVELLWIPELDDGVLLKGGENEGDWTLIGKSSQQGGGQIMHNSEFIGGGLADEILETPGYYVAIVCNRECTHGPDETSIDDCNEDHTEGWAVACRPLTS